MVINDENYEKGIVFEEYVKNLFNPEYFSLYAYTHDSSKFGIRAESDSNPDLTFRYIRTQERFGVECKFRSELYNNAINWAKSRQIGNYRRYENEDNIPTFIVIGLGGSPNRPKRMFCIPLMEIRYTKLYLSFLEQYERPPDKMFFWKNKSLQ